MGRKTNSRAEGKDRNLEGDGGGGAEQELVGFLRAQEELKSSQQQLAVGETVQTGFAIRKLPFLIAAKNRLRGADKEAAAANGASKTQQAPELGSFNDDDEDVVEVEESAERRFAVRGLAPLIAQKDLHAGRQQQEFKHLTTDEHEDVGDTREKGAAVRESAERTTPGAHVNGRDELHGCKLQESPQMEVEELGGQKKIGIDVNAPTPAIIAGEENDDEAGEESDGDAREDGGVAIILPQLGRLCIATEEEVEGDEDERVEDECLLGMAQWWLSRCVEAVDNETRKEKQENFLRFIQMLHSRYKEARDSRRSITAERDEALREARDSRRSTTAARDEALREKNELLEQCQRLQEELKFCRLLIRAIYSKSDGESSDLSPPLSGIPPPSWLGHQPWKPPACITGQKRS